MITSLGTQKRIIMVRCNNGEDILEKLQEAVKREDIKTAIIVSGFGSVYTYHFHVVASPELPPKEAFPKGDQALDIVGFSGAVVDGRVHAHITLTDDKIAMGGHLEPGCKTLTFAIITIMEVNDISITDWDTITIMN
jgi:Predicted DNA-binding protein with PD1-like DNA-binding motif